MPSIQSIFNETIVEPGIELSRLGSLIVADAGVQVLGFSTQK